MYKVLIINPNGRNTQKIRDFLVNHFEVSEIRHFTPQSLISNAKKPTLILYYDKVFDAYRFHSIRNLGEFIGIFMLIESYHLASEISAFEHGVDQFMLDSTPLQSIFARVKNHLNKWQAQQPSAHFVASELLPKPQMVRTFLHLKIHVEQNLVRDQLASLFLTPMESLIFVFLIDHQDQLISRKRIRDEVFKNSQMALRTVDAHVAKLKRKLPILKNYLLSIYGKGYLLTPKGRSRSNAA